MTEQKTVIITGASRGLGAGTARMAARLGAAVVLSARSAEALRAVAAEIETAGGRALAVPGDVSRAEDCRALVARAVAHFGRVDAVINNAGVLEPLARIAEADPEAWTRNIVVNVVGPFLVTQAALRYLRETGGRVINVSSGAAVSAKAAWSAYAVSKAALNHFTAHLAVEEPGITAVAVRPGVVDTAMQTAIREEGQAMEPEERARFVRLHEEGALQPPEVPGRALAVLALHAPHDWSGQFVSWDDGAVQALVRERGADQAGAAG